MEQSLRAVADRYASQVTSMLSNFPADEIRRIVTGYPSSARRHGGSSASIDASLAAYEQASRRLVDLADRYRDGERGHAAQVIANILLAYLAVEQHYQHGALSFAC